MSTERRYRSKQRTRAVRFMGRPLSIELSRSAKRALKETRAPLLVEMQLQFGCLIRKQVNFLNEDVDRSFVPVTSQISLAFQPVISQSCLIGKSRPSRQKRPSQTAGSFIPKWLCIDYRKGEWQGQFGYGV